jgi:hypothetical protein
MRLQQCMDGNQQGQQGQCNLGAHGDKQSITEEEEWVVDDDIAFSNACETVYFGPLVPSY